MAVASSFIRVARSLLTQTRIPITPLRIPGLVPRTLQNRAPFLEREVFCRQFSNLSLSSTRPAGLTLSSALNRSKVLSPQQNGCLALPVVPARTVVKHSKLGKMKTVKAVAKRFRRTGSGKLKFWPPGNVHNLLSKSHNRKCRIRRPCYASKSQAKTLNKMLIGRYS